VAATLNLLITGRPGIGKTTAVECVVARLPADAATGFYTREERARGVRRGFAIHTLDGRTATLARVGRGGGPTVGRYHVQVESLDAVAVPTLGPRPGVRLIVVDEIGRMECLSARFCDAVRAALDSGIAVLGTVARQGDGFIAEVRRRPDVTLLEMTAANRDSFPVRIAELLAI
jgi:nucleoside-triphosphatase